MDGDRLGYVRCKIQFVVDDLDVRARKLLERVREIGGRSIKLELRLLFVLDMKKIKH